MPKQPASPGLRDALKKKVTRREHLLVEMDAVVPCHTNSRAQCARSYQDWHNRLC